MKGTFFLSYFLFNFLLHFLHPVRLLFHSACLCIPSLTSSSASPQPPLLCLLPHCHPDTSSSFSFTLSSSFFSYVFCFIILQLLLQSCPTQLYSLDLKGAMGPTYVCSKSVHFRPAQEARIPVYYPCSLQQKCTFHHQNIFIHNHLCHSSFLFRP